MDSLQTLLAKLVAFPSISPDDAGCQAFMSEKLNSLGFICESFDNLPVKNFFARFGNKEPLLVFAGHTDVVSPGIESQWNTPPFSLTEKEGKLFGRGVADMKGSLAAMLHMAERLVTAYPLLSGSIGFLITSGEEGDHFDLGTPYVMSELKKKGIIIDYCIVGEPSSTQRVGDVIKIGRRGSLTGKLRLLGKQGHVAYPHLAENPIHKIAYPLAEMAAIEWDKGNTYFPPTSLQITHIHAGENATNIIPGVIDIQFNCRFSTEQTPEMIKNRVKACFETYKLNPNIEWRLNGEPFLTSEGKLLENIKEAILELTTQEPVLSTSGGTSDGRFIAPYGVEVIELGLINTSIHQVNETITLEDLELLEALYYRIAKKLCT